MSDFEKYLFKFVRNVLQGKLDLAVLKDKFIKGGLYLEKQDKVCKNENCRVGLYSDTLECYHEK